jgi:chorismate mutase
MTPTLEKIRSEIDKIDVKICHLLDKRLQLSLQTKPFKQKLQDKTREKAILSKISSKYLKSIYRSILKNSRQCQKDGNLL